MNNEKNNVENVVPVAAEPTVGASPVEQPVPVVPQQDLQPTPVAPQEVQAVPTFETNNNPSMKEEVKIVTNANSPTNVDDIKIDTITVDANAAITAKEYVEEEKYKVSGTASENDLKLDDKPVEEEVLDEGVEYEEDDSYYEDEEDDYEEEDEEWDDYEYGEYAKMTLSTLNKKGEGDKAAESKQAEISATTSISC